MRYLFDESEKIVCERDSEILRHPYLSNGERLYELRAGENCGPLKPGHYLIRETLAPGRIRTRYLGIVGKHYTVLQFAVGCFTSDYFDSEFHSKLVPANYYVNYPNLQDSTMLTFEKEYGDAVYPHLMPDAARSYGGESDKLEANWEALPEEKIVSILKKVDEWFQAHGFAPLHGFATYTPSNSLIRAMRQLGWKVLHSVVPEQNWSDGEWAINHWGMTNQPFYAGADDFRKPEKRGMHGNNVIEMTMDSYHLYMPHVVNWGDNVLSPSHFLRWSRTVESGDYPERFRNFLLDYLAAAEQSPDPFFLIAGFEFGRSYGVRSMTAHNRKGIEIVIEEAKHRPIVFATGRDVAEYYEKFCPCHPEHVFTQRDYLGGTAIMGKPLDSGPSIGMEMRDYKAVFEHGNFLPYYHYDYLETWTFPAADTTAPHDYAKADAEQISVTRTETGVTLTAKAPLPRCVPVAFWDAVPADGAFLPGRIFYPAVLDDGRKHSVLELPAGWQGNITIPVVQTGKPDPAEFEGLRHPAWRVQTIGTGVHRQCYLFPDIRLLGSFETDFTVPADCRIDSLERPLGNFHAGEVIRLHFDFRRTWYRFYGLSAGQLAPSDKNLQDLLQALAASDAFFSHAEEKLKQIHAEQDAFFAKKIPAGETVLLEIDCFGNSPFGERSRAKRFDRIVRQTQETLTAAEYSDGGISLGNGISFWTHPRGLRCRIRGIDTIQPGPDGMIHLLLFNTAHDAEPERYLVSVRCRGEVILCHPGVWEIPFDREDPHALLELALPKAAVTGNEISLEISADQRAVLDDWYADKGFIARLERLAVSVKR